MAEQKKESTLEDELRKLNRALAQQNSYYRRGSVILRSLSTGIFTALGTTIGFFLVVIVLASFIRTFSAVPVIQDILRETKLDKIIEYQLSLIDKQSPTPTPSPTQIQD
jgi:hypothetical protein